jgi:hypothetical protein
MKQLLETILSTDTSYNKSATRYLPRTHPDLWAKIVEATAFLPTTSKPKQRAWHILHEIYEIPKCPVTGEEVKWYENRYLKTLNYTAKAKMQHARGDFVNANAPEHRESRRQGNLLAVKNGRKYRNKATYSAADREKAKQTCLDRYGVGNGSQSKFARDKISDARIRNGATPKHLRGAYTKYNEAVFTYTRESWVEFQDKINPDCLPRGRTYTVDHIYSIYQGFMENIPAYIIGHWTNLQMLTLSENSHKNARCHKTQDQLFEDFFEVIG